MKDFKFKIDGKAFEVSVNEKDDTNVEVTVNGKAYSVELENAPKAAHAIRPAIHNVVSAAAPAAAAGTSSSIKSPLPGNITKILVKNGQKVRKGDVLLTMESMKMENNVSAEQDCTIKNIVAKEGQSVMQDDLLMEIEVAGASATAAAPAPAAPAKPAAPAAPAAAPKATAPAGAKIVASPLPGSVTKILVSTGQTVKVGDILLTMESMKMENNITSEFAGTVKNVFVQQGSTVMQGDNLVEIG